MATTKSRWPGQALGAKAGLLFFMLLAIGLVDLRIGLLVAAATIGVAWIILCFYRPLLAFSILLMVVTLAYTRLAVPLVSLQGGGNRGFLSVGDVLWLSLVLTWFARHVAIGKKIRFRQAYPAAVWAMLPFVLMHSLLPVLGVSFGDWPFSFAIPGFRNLQWASFALLAYVLAQQYGARTVIAHVLVVLAVAAVVHMAYGLIQLGYYQGVLGRSWVHLDDIQAARAFSWFYYPRLTGLHVNPNSYGVYSAMVFLLVLAMHLARADVGRRVLWVVVLLAALFGLFLSASRSAYLGVFVAFLIWLMLAPLDRERLFARGLKLITKLFLIGALSFVVLWPVLPTLLTGRMARFVDVLSEGAQMDPNAQARVEMWQLLWQTVGSEYPFGTWVPASYASDSAVDSFYVGTTLQGTPLFTVFWIVCLGGAARLGWNAWLRADNRQAAAIGLALAGFVGTMAGAGLTLSPMLGPGLVVPFWVLVGLSLAVVDGKH